MVLATSIALITVFTAYYVYFVKEKPRITTGNRRLHDFLASHVRSATRTYWPALFYFEGRLQTIFGLIKRLPAAHRLPYIREELTMADGGVVALDYLDSDHPVPCCPAPLRRDTPKRLTVLFFPGLTSSSQTSYVKTLVLAVSRCGANVIVFNNRGIGGLELKSPRTFNAIDLDDLLEVIEHLKAKFPGERFLALGTSFGTIKFGHYFTKFPEESASLFLGALFISSAFDAVRATESLETPINRWLINRAMAVALVQISKRNQEKLKNCSWFDMKTVAKVGTVREYDEAVTIRQFGFESTEDYYEKSSTIGSLHKLKIPVVSLNAMDDPIQPGACLPFQEANEPASRLALLTTKRGGHLGFLEGVWPAAKPVHLMERIAAEFVTAIQTHRDEWDRISK